MTQTTFERLMTVNEVAILFEVQSRTVREWLKADIMHGVKLPTGGWRIYESEVKRFAQTKYGS